MRTRSFVLLFILLIHANLYSQSFAGKMPVEKQFTNSIGMKFVRINAGEFMMGSTGKTLPQSVTDAHEFGSGRKVYIPEKGDADELNYHKVKISQAFYMGICEVTNAQYEQFDRLHQHLRGKKGFSVDADEAVVFVSWHEAKAFCDWLSKKEGVPYRLPTEAEWEYACRAGTTSIFSTGDSLPVKFIKNPDNSWYPDPVRGRGSAEIVRLYVGTTEPNPWGLHDMHGNVEEWCSDWYGPYSRSEQRNPVGYSDGNFKVTRGGSHGTFPFYLRSANRMGTVPDDRSWYIGFRIVIGNVPVNEYLQGPLLSAYQDNVKQQVPADILTKLAADEPYYEGPRSFVRIDDDHYGPPYTKHNHCPAIVECSNGDLLATWFSTITERGRELTVAASRLRYGQKEWDKASIFWNPPDRNVGALALWCDKNTNTIYHFNSISTAATWAPMAVILRTSADNGVTWSKTHMALPEHDSRHQVVESVFRTKEGWLVLPCDATPSGSGGTAVHISKDNGATWNDVGGTIAGIHAAVVQLNDGSLMAFGRGDEITSNIDTERPWMAPKVFGDKSDLPRCISKSVSRDMGRSWEYSKSPFPAIGGGQRLVFIKLMEGPLFFVSFSPKDDGSRAVPDVIEIDKSGNRKKIQGLFGALSFNQGKTWSIIKKIGDDLKGYLSICQGRNGVIHLVTSKNHYSFNLKWLQTPRL